MCRTILVMAGILGGGIPLFAQTAVNPVTNPVTPAVPTFEETVVVSASLDREERDDVPATVTVISAEELEARQADTLSEAVATVPGIAVMQAGPPGQQTSLFTRGTESEHTLLLWNGIPLNDPYFGAVNWQFVALDGVARVEVARGPFSALYGSGALGGVIQVFTGSRQGGTFTAEGGEDGYYRGGLAAGADLGNLRLDVTGHLRRGGGELPNDDYDSEEMLARGLWTVRPGVSVGLLARVNDSETGIPRVSGQPNLIGDIAWQERELAVPFLADLGAWEVEAQLSQTRFDSAFRDADDPFGFTASDTESEGLRGRAVATWRKDEDLWIAFGSETERLEVTSTSSFGTDLDAADQKTWAVFGQGSWGRGPIRLDLGVRRDDNDVYGTETSLRTGIVVKAGAGVRLRASYGEAFRAPSLGELFFPFSGNPDLQPETGESFEVGIEREAGGWRLGLTGFENRLRNLIDFDFVANRNLNVDRARTRGIEGEAGFRRGIFSATWNATWLETEDLSTGLDLFRRPERSSALVLTVRPGDWTLNLEGRYVGERADVDAVTFQRAENPDYLRVDLAARWRAFERLAPYARIQNVADEEYEEILGYPAPGRTLIGGVAVGFD
ncbi:MAG TPA: TonB-dependent receptor [Thermoanaerobaculia bacterium]|nr:TonB-dependent receptor [Thermoanaerobaculia bacterium]